MPNDADAPMGYELRIRGHLDQHWSTWFGGLALTREDDGTTTLRSAVADQAALHGLLAKVRDLGVTLISLTSLDAVHDPDSQAQQH
jgi:GTPase